MPQVKGNEGTYWLNPGKKAKSGDLVLSEDKLRDLSLPEQITPEEIELIESNRLAEKEEVKEEIEIGAVELKTEKPKTKGATK